MANKLSAEQVGVSPQLALRVSPEIIDALDREAERLRRERPGSKVQRSDVAREILHRALLVSDAPAPPKKAPAKGGAPSPRRSPTKTPKKRRAR